MSQIVEKCAIS